MEDYRESLLRRAEGLITNVSCTDDDDIEDVNMWLKEVQWLLYNHGVCKSCGTGPVLVTAEKVSGPALASTEGKDSKSTHQDEGSIPSGSTRVKANDRNIW